MPRFRRCTATAALGLCCATLPATAFAAPTPDAAHSLPGGLVWVSRGPGDDASALHRVTGTGVVTHTPLGFAVNAIGCAADGTVFGLATTRAGRKLRSGPHVVSIGGDGRITDLGAVRAPGYPLADGYGGTVVAGDGSVELLVGTASALRPVHVAPGTPRLLRARTLPALPYVGDWVVEPGSGDLLTVAARGGRAQLVRLSPGATKPALTPLPSTLPGRSAYGGLALHPDGTLTALFNQAAGPGAGPGTGRAPGGSALFRIPLARPERAAKVADLGSITSSDATTCPVPAPPPAAGVAAVPPPAAGVVVPPPAAAVPPPAAAVPPPAARVAAVPPPVAGVAAVPPPAVVPTPAPVVVPSAAAVLPTTTAAGPVPPPAPAPRMQVRRATPPATPRATTPRSAVPPPAVTPSRKSNVRPAPGSVASSAESPIGKRFIPVAGVFTIAAVAMTRLLRRRR